MKKQNTYLEGFEPVENMDKKSWNEVEDDWIFSQSAYKLYLRSIQKELGII